MMRKHCASFPPGCPADMTTHPGLRSSEVSHRSETLNLKTFKSTSRMRHTVQIPHFGVQTHHELQTHTHTHTHTRAHITYVHTHTTMPLKLSIHTCMHSPTHTKLC